MREVIYTCPVVFNFEGMSEQEIEEWKDNNPDYETRTEERRGTFLEFGLESNMVPVSMEEYGVVTNTVALIEEQTGYVISINPKLMRFI